MYKIIQTKITACDTEIEKMLNKIIDQDDNKRQHYIDKKSHKRTIGRRSAKILLKI